MDTFDRALWIALQQSPTLSRAPRYVTDLLRSWCLVLRAGDSRLGGDDQPLELTSKEVRYLCSPIRIDPPGVPIITAARRFGVGVNTLKRWARQGHLSIRHYQREPGDTFLRSDGSQHFIRGVDFYWPVTKISPRLNHALVTTRGCLWPGGEVYHGPWGELRRMIVDKIPDDIVFHLPRVRKAMGAQGGQWQWRCRWCDRLVFKIYWPIAFTSTEYVGVPAGWKTGVGGFMCRHCARITYESADHRENAMERFCRRISGGRFGWKEVRKHMEH